MNIHELLKSCIFLVLQCLPFWPENLSGELCVRVVGYESSSKPFLFNAQDNGTLLRLEELVRLALCGPFLVLHFSLMVLTLGKLESARSSRLKSCALRCWCTALQFCCIKKVVNQVCNVVNVFIAV